MIKPRAVVLGGNDDAVLNSHRCRHIEVSFRGRHEFPKALSGFHLPSAERMAIITHDLALPPKFDANKRRVGRGESRGGPAGSSGGTIQCGQRCVRTPGIHDKQIIHDQWRGTHAPGRQRHLKFARELPFPNDFAACELNTPQASKRAE